MVKETRLQSYSPTLRRLKRNLARLPERIDVPLLAEHFSR